MNKGKAIERYFEKHYTEDPWVDVQTLAALYFKIKWYMLAE